MKLLPHVFKHHIMISSTSKSKPSGLGKVACMLAIVACFFATRTLAQTVETGTSTATGVLDFAAKAAYELAHPITAVPVLMEEEEDEDMPLHLEAIAPGMMRTRAVSTTPPPMTPPAMMPASSAPAQTFQSTLDNGTTIPPDTHGAVDSNYCVTTINSTVKIQSRTGGAVSSVSLNSFWSPVLSGGGSFDPRVHYDPYSNRWIIVAVSGAQSSTSSVLLAVSQTSNPTGSWYEYKITAYSAGDYWLDFPNVGFNNKWIVVSGVLFQNSGGGYNGAKTFVFDKTTVYGGSSAPFTAFTQASSGNTAPALTYSSSLNSLFMIEAWNGASKALKLWKITGAVGSESMTAVGFPIGDAQWWYQPHPVSGTSFGDFAPQSGISNLVNNGDHRATQMVYVNNKLWLAHTVFLPYNASSNPTRSAIQWWQMDTAGTPQQFGRIDDSASGMFYAYPTIAVNQNDDALIGFAAMSASTHPSAAYALRMHTDVTDSFRTPYIFRSGQNTYYKTYGGSKNRWGDYSATAVDPINNTDFWTIQEASAATANLWDTWWAQVTVTSCSTPTVTGTMTVCTGATTTLSSGTSGGTWTSSATGVATVGSSTGVVTGVGAGTVTISYTVSGGCVGTATVTVNATPTSITGSTTVCAGATSTLSSTPTGGTWSSSVTAVGTIGSTTGVFTGISAGATVITYTKSGCTRTTTVNVNAAPTAFTVTGGGSYCSGGSGLAIGLSGSQSGVNYQLYNGAATVGSPLAGTGSALSFGTFTASGTYSVLATNASTACTKGMTGTATITINPLPTAFTVTGGGSYCTGGSGVAIGLSGSQSGVNYQLYNGASAVGSAVSGTGSALSFGLQTAAGTYTVLATNATTSCTKAMTGSATVTITSAPAAIAGTFTVCAGSTTTLTDATSGGTWSSSMPSVATVGSATGVVSGSIAGTTTISYILSGGCFATATFTVLASPAAITGTLNACVGASSTLSSATSGGSWSSSNTSVGTVNATTGAVTGISAGTTTISYTIAGCSKTATFTVNPLPSAGGITGPGSVCAGATITLGSTVGGGSWTSSMPSVATVGSSTGVVTGSIAGTTTISYTVTNACGSATVTKDITVNPLPNAGTLSGVDLMCETGAVTITTTGSGGSWSTSNTAIGTIDASGNLYGVGNGTVIVSYTVTNSCGTAVATHTTTVLPLPSSGSISGASSVCVGGSTSLSATIGGGSWTSSNPSVASVTSTGLVTGASVGTATISYTVTNSCGSATVTFNVTVTAPPTISGPGSVCAGSSITLTGSSAGGTWSSSSTSVATVGSATGVVTGVSSGSVIITYMLAGGCYGTYAVTVGAASVSRGSAGFIAGSSPFQDSLWTFSPTDYHVLTRLGPTITGGPISGTVTGMTGLAKDPVTGVTYIILKVSGISNRVLGTINLSTGNCTTIGNMGDKFATIAFNANGTLFGVTGNGASVPSTMYRINKATAAKTLFRTLGAGADGEIIMYCTDNNYFYHWSGNGTVVWERFDTSGTDAIQTLSYSGTPGGETFGALYLGGGQILASNISSQFKIWDTSGTIGSALSSNPDDIRGMVMGGCSSSISAACPTTICAGGSVSLSVTGGTGGYQWYLNGAAISGATDATYSASAGGVYNCIYTDGCGISDSTAYGITVTVSASPAAIGGATSVTVGSTTTLTNTVSGGTWSSSNTSVATIGSTSGVVTGVAVGSTTITYMLSSGCYATLNFTVMSAFDDPITGTLEICDGSTTTLSNATSGGTWSSSTTSVATITSGGVVTGVSPGTSTITYTALGAYVTAVVTVDPLPSVISGASSVCIGATTTFTSSPSGGTWSSNNSSIADVSSTGDVTGMSAGATTITYMLSTGCYRTKSITVNSLPTISGTLSVCEGNTTVLTGTGGTGLTWVSSDPSVATIGSTSGLVTGIMAGTTEITYTLATGCQSTVIFTVNPAAGAISGPTSVCVGSTIDLTTSSGCGTWSSSNTGVATVSSVPSIIIEGSTTTVTGIAAGTATITFTTCDGCITTYAITVNPVPAAITGTTLLCVGSSATLSSATSGGMWTSSDPTVADVISVTGFVTGLNVGTTTIAYTTGAGCSATTVVSVSAAPTAISGPSDMCIGLGITLTNSTSGGTWSSSNTSIATVTAGGVVTGVATGAATITYTLSAGCYVTKDISVNALPSTITGASSVCFGLTTTLSSTPSGGTWTSSNPSVGSVDATTGVVTGVSAGATTITYMLSTGCYRTMAFTVNAMPSAITGASSICVGSSTTLSNSSGGGLSWSSSNTAVATIGSGSGLVNGLTVGTTTISFLTTSGCYATMVLTVTAAPGTITGTASVCSGSTTTLSCTPGGGVWSSSFPAAATVNSSTGVVTGVAAGTSVITYALGSCYVTLVVSVTSAASAITGTTSFCSGTTSTLSATPFGGTWSSSNTGVASFGTATSGILTGVAAGTSAITYTVGAGCQSFTTVTITAGPSAITGTLAVCAGSMVTLSNATPGGTWSSGTTGVATIGSATGVLTGMSAGTSNISYTVGGCRATAIVSVSAAPAAITGTTNVCVGSSVTFSHVTPGGTWASSNVALATVGSSTGVVTGVGAGTPTITYFVTPGCYKTKSITVNGGSLAITGNTNVCQGSTSVLVCTTPGGLSWSSSNPAVATIGSTSGNVTAISVGTTEITYTATSGCTSFTTVSVLSLPTAISGTLTLCQGATTALASVGTGGGTWVSSVLSKATVGSSSGIVSGIAGGTSNITYTWTNGCTRNAQVTVNPLPTAGAIVGAGTMSLTSTPTQTLTASSPGGTWASSTPAVATIGAGTGFMQAVSVGTVRITYTVTNGCGTAFVTRLFSVVTGRPGITTGLGEDVKFSVYPNPTTGILTIETPVAGVFNVYTIDDRLVSSKAIKDAKTIMSLPENLAAGIYMCRFSGDDGTVATVKVVLEPK